MGTINSSENEIIYKKDKGYKLHYISGIFRKISNKGIETYAISRIWHLLNDYDIKMMPQQFISRSYDQYALTDVYFPQFDIHIEINEAAHLKKVAEDVKRQDEIERNTGHIVLNIDCSLSLQEIHSTIDNIVATINAKKENQKINGTFKPWKPETEFKPSYWRGRGTISTSEEVNLNTIENICELFDIDSKRSKNGFLRKGAISLPEDKSTLLWWPSLTSRSGWNNEYFEKDEVIKETNNDPIKNSNHLNYHSSIIETRFVFFHYKDVLGFKNYKFLGVFKNDPNLSTPEAGVIWKRIGTKLDLATYKFS